MQDLDKVYIILKDIFLLHMESSITFYYDSNKYLLSSYTIFFVFIRTSHFVWRFMQKWIFFVAISSISCQYIDCWWYILCTENKIECHTLIWAISEVLMLNVHDIRTQHGLHWIWGKYIRNLGKTLDFILAS